MDPADLVHMLPLVSAALWSFIAVGGFGRYGGTSPFVRALILFCALVSAGCLADWYFLTFVSAADSLAVILAAGTRTTFLAAASLVILLASKWIAWGHSRYDGLLLLPLAGAVFLVWDGMITSVTQAPWGPQIDRDPLRFGLFAAQELAYYLAAVYFSLSLVNRRWDLPPRLRRSALLSIWALVVFVALWLVTNFASTMFQLSLPPLFSSLLFIPALLDAIAFGRLTPEEMGDIFRAVSEINRRVLALYVFYRSGEPLATVGASQSLPMEAEQLESVLRVVGNFVETSMRNPRGYPVTSMQFDRLGMLAIRGNTLIVAAVYDGPAYDALRSELQRKMSIFEEAHEDELRTLDGASRIADVIADDLSALLLPSMANRRAA